MMRKITLAASLLAASLTMVGCDKEPEYVHVGENWAAINQMESSKDAFDISIDVNKSEFKEGEKLELKVRSPKEGRVWLVQVDPTDKVTLMLPNQGHPDNRIKKNKPVYFPPKDANWEAKASKPYGKSVLAVIVTTGDTDLNAVFSNQSGGKDLMNKAFVVAGKDPEWAVAKTVISVVEDE